MRQCHCDTPLAEKQSLCMPVDCFVVLQSTTPRNDPLLLSLRAAGEAIPVLVDCFVILFLAMTYCCCRCEPQAKQSIHHHSYFSFCHSHESGNPDFCSPLSRGDILKLGSFNSVLTLNYRTLELLNQETGFLLKHTLEEAHGQE